MSFVYSIAVGITRGLFLGFVIALILVLLRRKRYTTATADKQRRTLALFKRLSPYVAILTFLVLLCGLVWTAYFLILGLHDPAQLEYANGVSQLIVSVLTVFSILVAFFEFLRRKD